MSINVNANGESTEDGSQSFAERIEEMTMGDDAQDLLLDMADAVESAQADAQTAKQLASDAQSRLLGVREEKAELESEVETLKEENKELENRVDELQSRTDLMDQVAQGSAMKVERRAAVLIQTLYNNAYRNKQSNSDSAPTASMDWRGGQSALGGSIDRSGVYRTFEKADELVDGAVVTFKKESRSSSKNSRLTLDLREEEPPATIAGKKIVTPEVQ